MSARLSFQDAKTLSLASLGGALEFYDFIVFLTFATTLQHLFFPSDSLLFSTTMTYLTYAVAYFVRPLSGIIIAHFGDRFGRKKTFMFTLYMMAIPTLIIGLLPTFAEIGYLASALLFLMRILQGIALGGEVPSAHVFVSEHVPPNRIGIANSMIASGLTFGVLIGHFVSSMLSNYFTPDEITAYAWRFPFILGGGLGFFAIYLRRHLQETPVFLEMKAKKKVNADIPVKIVLKKYREATYVAILSTWLLITGVVLILLAPNLMKSELFNLNPQFVNKAALIATVMNIIGSLFAGILVDRIGVRKTLLIYSLFLAITSYLFFSSLNLGDQSIIAGLYAISAFFLGLVACVPIIIIKLFPPDIRLSGIGFSYNIGNAFFAGLTTFLVPIIAHQANPMFIAYYLLFLCLLGVFLSFYLKKRSLKFK